VTKDLLVFIQTQGSVADLSLSLASLGIQNEGFKDPQGFLTRLRDGKPGGCIIDLTFKDAHVMVAMIKSIRKVLGPKLPVIVLMNQGDDATRALALAAGANDTVDIPPTPVELRKTISKHIYLPGDKAPAPAPAAAPPAPAEKTYAPLPKAEIPALIKWFFEKVSPSMAALNSSLEEHADSEVQVKFYTERLLPYRENFVTMIKMMRKTETKQELHQCIRMYGLRNTKHLLVAAKLSEVTQAGLIGWNTKTGLLSADPKKIIQYAAKTVDHFGEGGRYDQIAFKAGLVLDLLFVMAEATGARKSAIRKMIEETYTQAIKMADQGIEAGKSAKSLALEQHIITAFLMREAGKIGMALFYPDYMELRSKLERKGLHPALQHIAEMEKFSVSHNIIGALICQGAPGLGVAYKSVLFFEYPFMLRDVPEARDAYELLEICKQVPRPAK
jgi:CheY-like chemotaxis protein